MIGHERDEIAGRRKGWRVAGALAAIALVALPGCRDVIVLEASVGRLVERSCTRAEGSPIVVARSIRVQVVEWEGGQPSAMLDSECFDDLDVSIERPVDLLDWFNERGYVARDIPTDAPTRVQIVAYGARGCLQELRSLPRVCAVSEDTLSETGFSAGDTARFSFYCWPEDDLPTTSFTACLGGRS